ncbi:DUF418 domain-containing protein [Qipengyuania soli]|uniref:DUF418 domain-containing protein n=1 Tax=Qipengyuania soli TaxID=2782568 RepID=A0A7S8F6N4_9SPHN|nr:DUF418 domain-containing protein [Qipengyuania soli]QPD00162.1 DUF418 domain-containing protein [Qipengyuania soli]
MADLATGGRIAWKCGGALMEELRGTLAAPVAQNERIDEVDVLRGFALLGVLTVNFVGFAGGGLMATDTQLATLPTARLDHIVDFIVEVLLVDKANTIFATLFGLGFYIQISRNGDRPGFVARYSRRLAWLWVFGMLNLTLLWVWDILNVYAIAGFILLAARHWKTRTFVIVGFLLAMISTDVQRAVAEMAGIPLMDWEPYSDASVHARQAASEAGDYLGMVGLMWRYTRDEWFVGGLFLVWLAYAPGRFMLGAAIGRSGLVDNIAGNLPLLRRIRNVILPLGLLVALAIVSVDAGAPGIDEKAGGYIRSFLESPAALLLAAGYACMVATGWHNPTGRRILAPFRPVGQMALTNYLMQGLAYAFVLFGIGPGLALGGKIGTSIVVLICLAFFAFQMAFSAWWLARYRFGPMEWLWRWLTYGGSAPAMRRLAPAQAAA